MIVDYKSRKNEVLDSYVKLEDIVSELQEYAKEIEMPDPMETLGTLMKDIRDKAEKVKADRFNIIIAGESKSGKSTFINAYLGVDLLPMDVKQCTSSIIEIKYGDSFSVKATYADDRVIEIKEDGKAHDFLKKNAALDDNYRDIPVPTINSEILVKAGRLARDKGRHISISKADVNAMLKDSRIQAANIHNISDYNKRIWKYIEERKDHWKDIVTKIEVMSPLSDNLRGIEIIDSPGVCARGGVSEITSGYIKNADAIIFLKPVIGQAVESEQFNQFMEEVSVERNKDALFLVLTHIAAKNDADICRLEEAVYEHFSSKLDKDHILFVDSKAELYAKKFHDSDDIETELRRLNDEKELDDFVIKAYTEATGFLKSSDNNTSFIEKLKEKSRFKRVYDSLETFGRKAHYLLLESLLASIIRVYSKLWNDMDSRIAMFKQKAEDPNELAYKIANVKQELENLQSKLSKGVDAVVRDFRGDSTKKGIIENEADSAVADFLTSVEKIDPESDAAFNKLKQASLQKIDLFVDVTEKLQKQAVEEFDKKLIALSNKDSIPFESLKPDFTDATFKEIKESTEAKAKERKSYVSGHSFWKTTHYYSVYVQNKHFRIIKDDISDRLNIIKNDLTTHLGEFIEKIRTKYIEELKRNADARKSELDAIMEAKITAEQNQLIISKLSDQQTIIETNQKEVTQLRGGIEQYVHRIHST